MACILVVDDEESVRLVLRKLLEREGHRIVSAHDGEEALDAVNKVAPDLVITDLVMPRMDGLQMISALRESHPHTPIIAISGGSNNHGETRLVSARKLGVAETLAKPFDREALLHAVGKALSVA